MPAVLDVGAWPLLAGPPPIGPEKPRNERGGGMREPVLLRFRLWVRGGPWCSRPARSVKRGTMGGSAASITGSVLDVYKDSVSRRLGSPCCDECTLVGPCLATAVLPFATRMESRILFLRRRAPCRGISKSGMVGCGTGRGAATISGTA